MQPELLAQCGRLDGLLPGVPCGGTLQMIVIGDLLVVSKCSFCKHVHEVVKIVPERVETEDSRD